MEFEVGQRVTLNIKNFRMLDGLVTCFTTKYVGPYEIFTKPHFDVEITNEFCCTSNLRCFKIKVVPLRRKRPN